jgi:hypothetical protein
MALYNPAFIAGGDIKPARFVRITGEFTISQCSAHTQSIIGVSQEGTFSPPNLATLLGGTESGLAASEGQSLKVFGLGDVCMIFAGSGGVTAGTKVKSDGDGKAVNIGTAAGTYHVGGTALNTVAAGEKVLIQVNPHVVVVA